MVPPCSDRMSRVPPYSISLRGRFHVRDFHPLWCDFPDTSISGPRSLRANPRSLVATKGISVDFFSSGYLDISVPRVRLSNLFYSVGDTAEAVGFPIRTPPDITSAHDSPRFIAVYRVLLRLLAPRHPPYALSSLHVMRRN
jgi:hypothetical protein